MRSAIILLATAAAVSAGACKEDKYKSHAACQKKQSETYKKELPTYRTYNCDAVSEACHAPNGYGETYGDGKDYTYQRKYPYPGPKTRFCLKVKKIKKGIKKVVGAVVGFFASIVHHIGHKIKSAWVSFKAHFEEWCATAKSDFERFEDWKKCEAAKWKAFWEYYHDLCRTRKALWDDAMREFHRHWHHYKKCRKAEYEESRKKCKVEEPKDYDDEEEYKKPETGNYLGYTPYEVKNYGVKYEKPKYDTYSKKADEKHSKEYNGYQDKPYTEYVAKYPKEAAKYD
jgi:hypothetical protein